MEKTNNEVTIVCNHASYNGDCFQRLNLFGKDQMNVFPQISLFREYFDEITPRLVDFIEIATFIYVADQCHVRCQGRVDPHGLLWHRKFNMIIAVQDYDFWSRADVKKVLERLLRFLSDDCFCFQFKKMTEIHPEQQYLVFDDKMGAPEKPKRVMLFSGGLDSLAGAVQSLIKDGIPTVLVRHKSTSKHKGKFEFIEKELNRLSNNAGTFFTFKAGKDGDLSKEYTQRTRSILYFAFAAVVADLLNINEVRFYENGPVSLNLPMSPQVVGGRATKTTHPQTLHYFQDLYRIISDKPDFKVTNPFIDNTKSEIVKLIVEYGCADLIKESMSCAHSWQQTNVVKHCGTCSQCIDRRVAIIAAGKQEFDNEQDYSTDFFTESVDVHHKDYADHFDAPNKNLLASYFLRGKEIKDMTFEDFLQEFPQVGDAVLYMGKACTNAAKDIYRLYKKLADDIEYVIKYANSDRFQARMSDINNPLPEDCLLYILTRVHQSSVLVKKVQTEIIPLPDYMFCQKGAMWHVRFDGGAKEQFLPHLEGCNYIVKLLSNPNKTIEYSELLPCSPGDSNIHLDGDEIAAMNVGKSESYIESIDFKAKQAYYRKREELGKQLQNHEYSCDTEREEMQAEYDKIGAELSSSLKKGGKARNLNKNEKLKQDAVSRACRTVFKKIAKFNPAMAEHLKNNISFGANPIYKCPNESIIWHTS